MDLDLEDKILSIPIKKDIKLNPLIKNTTGLVETEKLALSKAFEIVNDPLSTKLDRNSALDKFKDMTRHNQCSVIPAFNEKLDHLEIMTH